MFWYSRQHDVRIEYPYRDAMSESNLRLCAKVMSETNIWSEWLQNFAPFPLLRTKELSYRVAAYKRLVAWVFIAGYYTTSS